VAVFSVEIELFYLLFDWVLYQALQLVEQIFLTFNALKPILISKNVRIYVADTIVYSIFLLKNYLISCTL
jgi:hypothetical protein